MNTGDGKGTTGTAHTGVALTYTGQSKATTGSSSTPQEGPSKGKDTAGTTLYERPRASQWGLHRTPGGSFK